MVIEISGELNFDGNSHVNLDCYSYRFEEFNSVFYVLERSLVQFEQTSLRPDKNMRIGTRFTLIGYNNIKKVEEFLKFSLFGSRGNTRQNSGQSYSCKRLEVLGDRRDCKTIYAEDDYRANVICAIVAKQQNWFSGTASPGTCGDGQ